MTENTIRDSISIPFEISTQKYTSDCKKVITKSIIPNPKNFPKINS